MKVTFDNRLKPADNEENTPDKCKEVIYNHNLRAPIKVCIIRNDNSPDNKKDWTISIEGNKSLIEQFQERLTKEVVTYLTRRVRNRFSSLTFADIVELSKMKSIH